MAKKTQALPAFEDCTFILDVVEDNTPVRGNAMASGDDGLDQWVENQIIEALENANIWAWCIVTVTAAWSGWKGVDILGGCSYKDEDDFIRAGQWDEMRRIAYHDLLEKLGASGSYSTRKEEETP
jgi:hypothetical protein